MVLISGLNQEDIIRFLNEKFGCYLCQVLMIIGLVFFSTQTSFFKKICSVYFAFDGRLYLRLLMFRLNDRCALGFDMPPPR
jgi:hypothetical protein